MPVNKRHPMACGRGFTLIEVLVAVVILSVGLLGLAGLQISGLRNNQEAYLRSQATIIAQDILERMRANRVAAMDSDYDTDFGVAANGDGSVAEQDLKSWKEWIGVVLPEGAGKVTVENDGVVDVQVRWRERTNEDGDNNQFIIFRTESRL